MDETLKDFLEFTVPSPRKDWKQQMTRKEMAPATPPVYVDPRALVYAMAPEKPRSRWEASQVSVGMAVVREKKGALSVEKG